MKLTDSYLRWISSISSWRFVLGALYICMGLHTSTVRCFFFVYNPDRRPASENQGCGRDLELGNSTDIKN